MMENIHLRLKKNDLGENYNAFDDLGDEGANGSQQLYEQLPDRKQVQELWNLIDELNEKTDELKGKTSH